MRPRTGWIIAVALAALSALAPAVATADDVAFTLAPGSPHPTGLDDAAVVVADVDGDGNGDVVLGGEFDSSLSVWWGRGDGTFDAPTTFDIGHTILYVHAVRLDGDPDVDLLTGYSEVVPVLNDGDRTFTVGTARAVSAGGEAADEMARMVTGDFDGDGDNDVAFVARDTSYLSDYDGLLRIFANNGSGVFSVGDDPEGYVSVPFGVATGRFNNDNDPDLVYGYTEGENEVMKVLLGSTGLTFTPGQKIPAGDGFPTDAADLDAPGDGFSDIVVDGSIDVAWAKGDGTFDAPAHLDDDSYANVAVGDVTGDGLADLVGIATTTRVLTNHGARSFAPGGSLTVPAEFGASGAVGDLDGDPRDDLVAIYDTDDDFLDDFAAYLSRQSADGGGGGGDGGGGPPPPGGGTTAPPQQGPPMVVPPGGGPSQVVPVKASRIAVLPGKRVCGSRRKFQIRLRRPPEGVVVKEARVLVNGKRIAVRRGVRLTAPVDLRGLPRGRAVVTIRITLADGRVLRGRRVYHPCAKKKRKGKFGRKRG
jgi:VCBS repeat protein